MKDKPYPITGHACFFPDRNLPFPYDTYPWKETAFEYDFGKVKLKRAKPLAPKRVVKRAKKKGKAK